MILRSAISIFFIVFLIFSHSHVWSSQFEEQDSYHEWLRQYGAMDVYALSVREREAGPRGQMDYADALISLGNPQSALAVLGRIDTGNDPLLEGQKHWIRHRALRQLGDFDQSVLAVIESSSYLGTDGTSGLMKNESGLNMLWSNVWKRWFFQSLSPELINEGRRSIMEQSIVLARSAWPDMKIWERVRLPLSAAKPLLPGPTSDQVRISQAMALWSISNWKLAEEVLTGVSDPDKRSFFTNYGRYLQSSNLNLWDSNLKTKKSSGFTEVYATHLRKFALDDYAMTPAQAGSWEAFLDRIRESSSERALSLINQELSSALLSHEVRTRLQLLAFIYQLQEKHYQEALETWDANLSHLADLPYTILLSVSLLKQSYEPLTILPSTRYPFLRDTLNAAGLNLDPEYLASFWDQQQISLVNYYKEFPLDYAVNYLFYKQSYQAGQDHSSARNLAFLFPYSETGQSAYLNLAEHAYKEGNKALAWRYLQNISEEFAQGPRQLDLLEAKAGILMDMGREDESLSTYQLILEKSPERLSHQRRLRLALLAQEKGQWNSAQEILEALWAERGSISSALQAEILFWLGEGAQHQGDLEQALDYYLRLSWQFPEQNIWAVTAMYRAGLIYEQRGILETARNLFQTVLKNADRSSQKEAARQRLDAIESRMGQTSDADSFLF